MWGLFALLFAGIGYWPNVISRVGLRFPLYPLFVAPTLYYLLRGLRTRNRNDFILSGLFLGLGLHGYSPIRILPICGGNRLWIVFYPRQIHRPATERSTMAGDPGTGFAIRLHALAALQY